MKIFIVILLSILMFFNSSLLTIIFSLKILEVNDQALEFSFTTEDNNPQGIISAGLFILKLPCNSDTKTNRNNIKWINDSEFLLDGYYCDVVSKRIINDTLNIFYVHDREEDELNSIYRANFEKEDNNKAGAGYFNVLFSFLSNALFSNKFHLYPPGANANSLSEVSFSLPVNKPDVPKPPPKPCS